MRIVSENLSYVYNADSPFETRALDNVSLTIEEGEFFGIIGHTGSGKSTFIRHLNGLIPVTEGKLTVGGTNMRMLTKKEFGSAGEEACPTAFENGKKLRYGKYKKNFRLGLKALRANIGMVFQYPEHQLFGETVFDDVAFGLKNFHPEISHAELENRVKEAVSLVGLNYTEIKDVSPFDLSGGQKRRVAIAGVIITRPQVLALDEPVAGLDPTGKKELMQLLHDLHGKTVKTVIIVSHDMDDVAENCSRVAVFSNGKVIREAPPSELFKDVDGLLSIGLDAPLTARLARALEKDGVKLQTNFTAADFIRAVTETYKNTKVH